MKTELRSIDDMSTGEILFAIEGNLRSRRRDRVYFYLSAIGAAVALWCLSQPGLSDSSVILNVLALGCWGYAGHHNAAVLDLRKNNLIKLKHALKERYGTDDDGDCTT